MKRFSIDKKVEIKTDFELDGLYVISIGEIDNKVVLFCCDYENGPDNISIFNTSSKKFTGDLPELETILEDPETHLKVTVRNNLLLVTTEVILKFLFYFRD